jgi:hyperosmotically inducible protein
MSGGPPSQIQNTFFVRQTFANIGARSILPCPFSFESNDIEPHSTTLWEEIMKKAHRALVTPFLVASLFFGALVSPASLPQKSQEPKTQKALIREVRHQLVMLPYYSVFDNLAYKVEGDKVILEGQVVRPTLKSDAEAAVKSIEGVSTVVNNIEVLPLSPMDDQLRRAVYRAVYGESGLQRYAEAAVPSIHIIVKNGNVTLEGVVDSEADKNLANLRASQVPNVFSVKNNLTVAGSGK